jgi:hypothetical protein
MYEGRTYYGVSAEDFDIGEEQLRALGEADVSDAQVSDRGHNCVCA